jgi:hypothetical protein
VSYLYYTLYRHLLKIETNPTPAFSAIALMTLFEFFNILTIFQFLPANPLSDNKSKNEGLLSYIVAGLVILIINYLILFKKTSHLINKYHDESKTSMLRGTILLVSYFVLSIAGFFEAIG